MVQKTQGIDICNLDNNEILSIIFIILLIYYYKELVNMDAAAYHDHVQSNFIDLTIFLLFNINLLFNIKY